MTHQDKRHKEPTLVTIFEHTWPQNDSSASMSVRYNRDTHEAVVYVSNKLSGEQATINVPNGALSALHTYLGNFLSRRAVAATLAIGAITKPSDGPQPRPRPDLGNHTMESAQTLEERQRSQDGDRNRCLPGIDAERDVLSGNALKSKNALVASIDHRLHDLANHPDQKVREAAELAHGELHDLAAVISDNPEIRASVMESAQAH